MSSKMMMGIFFIFICGQILCLICEGAWLGDSDMQVINELIGFDITTLDGANPLEMVSAGWGFFTHGIPNMLSWDYSFFYGTFALVKIILLFPLSVGVVWGLISLFAPLVSGLAERLYSWLPI